MNQSSETIVGKLPTVFEKEDVQKILDCSEKAVSVYLHRWKLKGLISSAGPRTGIHFNRLRCPLLEDEMYWESAARKTDEFAPVNIKLFIDKGWVMPKKEIFSPRRIIVPSGQILAKHFDLEIVMRPRKYYTKLSKFQSSDKNRWFEMRLSEACILADLKTMEADRWDIAWSELPETVLQALEKIVEVLKTKKT